MEKIRHHSKLKNFKERTGNALEFFTETSIFLEMDSLNKQRGNPVLREKSGKEEYHLNWEDFIEGEINKHNYRGEKNTWEEVGEEEFRSRFNAGRILYGTGEENIKIADKYQDNPGRSEKEEWDILNKHQDAEFRSYFGIAETEKVPVPTVKENLTVEKLKNPNSNKKPTSKEVLSIIVGKNVFLYQDLFGTFMPPTVFLKETYLSMSYWKLLKGNKKIVFLSSCREKDFNDIIGMLPEGMFIVRESFKGEEVFEELSSMAESKRDGLFKIDGNDMREFVEKIQEDKENE